MNDYIKVSAAIAGDICQGMVAACAYSDALTTAVKILQGSSPLAPEKEPAGSAKEPASPGLWGRVTRIAQGAASVLKKPLVAEAAWATAAFACHAVAQRQLPALGDCLPSQMSSNALMVGPALALGSTLWAAPQIYRSLKTFVSQWKATRANEALTPLVDKAFESDSKINAEILALDEQLQQQISLRLSTEAERQALSRLWAFVSRDLLHQLRQHREQGRAQLETLMDQADIQDGAVRQELVRVMPWATDSSLLQAQDLQADSESKKLAEKLLELSDQRMQALETLPPELKILVLRRRLSIQVQFIVRECLSEQVFFKRQLLDFFDDEASRLLWIRLSSALDLPHLVDLIQKPDAPLKEIQELLNLCPSPPLGPEPGTKDKVLTVLRSLSSNPKAQAWARSVQAAQELLQSRLKALVDLNIPNVSTLDAVANTSLEAAKVAWWAAQALPFAPLLHANYQRDRMAARMATLHAATHGQSGGWKTLFPWRSQEVPYDQMAPDDPRRMKIEQNLKELEQEYAEANSQFLPASQYPNSWPTSCLNGMGWLLRQVFLPVSQVSALSAMTTSWDMGFALLATLPSAKPDVNSPAVTQWTGKQVFRLASWMAPRLLEPLTNSVARLSVAQAMTGEVLLALPVLPAMVKTAWHSAQAGWCALRGLASKNEQAKAEFAQRKIEHQKQSTLASYSLLSLGGSNVSVPSLTALPDLVKTAWHTANAGWYALRERWNGDEKAKADFAKRKVAHQEEAADHKHQLSMNGMPISALVAGGYLLLNDYTVRNFLGSMAARLLQPLLPASTTFGDQPNDLATTQTLGRLLLASPLIYRVGRRWIQSGLERAWSWKNQKPGAVTETSVKPTARLASEQVFLLNALRLYLQPIAYQRAALGLTLASEMSRYGYDKTANAVRIGKLPSDFVLGGEDAEDCATTIIASSSDWKDCMLRHEPSCDRLQEQFRQAPGSDLEAHCPDTYADFQKRLSQILWPRRQEQKRQIEQILATVHSELTQGFKKELCDQEGTVSDTPEDLPISKDLPLAQALHCRYSQDVVAERVQQLLALPVEEAIQVYQEAIGALDHTKFANQSSADEVVAKGFASLQHLEAVRQAHFKVGRALRVEEAFREMSTDLSCSKSVRDLMAHNDLCVQGNHAEACASLQETAAALADRCPRTFEILQEMSFQDKSSGRQPQMNPLDYPALGS